MDTAFTDYAKRLADKTQRKEKDKKEEDFNMYRAFSRSTKRLADETPKKEKDKKEEDFNMYRAFSRSTKRLADETPKKEKDKKEEDFNMYRTFSRSTKRLADETPKKEDKKEDDFNMYRAFSSTKRLADETKKAEDQKSRIFMNRVNENMLPHSYNKFAIQPYENSKFNPPSASSGIERTLDVIPQSVLAAKDDLATLTNIPSSTITTVGLATANLGVGALKNIWRWWRGEITGKQCAKNVLDSIVSMGGAVAGGFAGMAVGSIIGGPLGAIVGSIAAGAISAAVVGSLCERLTQNIFGKPKNKALENAYRYLGVEMTASNAEVNSAFHRLCLKHHPDKGGKEEDFYVLQCHMGVIKTARGDL